MTYRHMIVCAANKYIITMPNGDKNTMVIPDVGHFCNNMRNIIKTLKGVGCTLSVDKTLDDRGQGFLDQNGDFHNRSDAYKIAVESGQELNLQFVLPNDKLDSSCLRHFEI